MSQKPDANAFRMSLPGDASVDIKAEKTAPTRGAGTVTPVLYFAYGCYSWVALLAIVIPLCVLLAFLPGLHRRRRLARGAARLFLRMIGSPAQ